MAHLSTAEDIVKFITLLLIDILTFFGNGIMIFAGIRSNELRKFSNSFIFNMAFADLCQSILVMPFGLASIYYGEWPLSSAGCRVSSILKVVITLASVQSLAGISIDRYFYIVKHRLAIDSKKRVIVSVSIVWLISIFLSIAPFFGWGELGFDYGKEVCTILFYKTASYTVVVFGIGLFIPVSIMAVCYYKIFMVLRLQGLKFTTSSKTIDIEMSDTRRGIGNKNAVSSCHEATEECTNHNACETGQKGDWCEQEAAISEAKDGQKRRMQRSFTAKEMHLLRSATLVMLVFVSCWLPYVIFNLLRAFNAVEENRGIAGITMWMGFANSALNPMIYGLTNRQFRNAIKKVLKQSCK